MTGSQATRIKCVVWDLDNTLWAGVLLEHPQVHLRPGVVDTIRLLDARGVLQSVASKNDSARATTRLRELNLEDCFLYPQISWGPKSEAVARIADELNIALDSVLFVDDDPFERAEVAAALPMVRCVDSADLATVAQHPGIPSAGEITAEAAGRRVLYQREARRRDHESSFGGTKVEFLASLRLSLQIHRATPADLERAAELTERTNQLNTTGVVYDQLAMVDLSEDHEHAVLVLSLDDVFGDYGQIGVVVGRRDESAGEFRLLLFLLSCRVMGRNLVPPIVAALAAAADARGLSLTADFRETEVNRQMYLAYRLAGFRVVSDDQEIKRLRLSDEASRTVPEYVELRMRDDVLVARSSVVP